MNKQRGFTLIELILYVGIVGSLLLTCSLFLGLIQEAQAKNQSIAEVDQQGSAAIEYIARTVRGATSVTTPKPGATTGSLVLVAGAPPPISFAVNGGALQVTIAGVAHTLTNNKVAVQSVTFANLARNNTHGIIRINFTLSRLNPNGLPAYAYTKTFTLSAGVRQ